MASSQSKWMHITSHLVRSPLQKSMAWLEAKNTRRRKWSSQK
uniref:Uncharacterized protein n=1 Tax=Arundo donax TaxID=35708 RepID=A0A0A9EBU5_ARUDO